jgi:hypothetical protein
MADKNTDYYLDALEENIRRDAAPNMAPLSKKLRYAEFDITLQTDYIAQNDNYVLGKLPCDAFIIPTLSFLVGVSGSVQGVFTVEKVTASGASPTAIGASVTIATDGTPVALGAGTGLISTSNYLQLTINTATALANGDVVKLLVAYVPTNDVVN